MGVNRELLLMTIIHFKNNDFGKLIKSKRKQQKITQQKLCELADIAVIYLSKIENGHSIPSQKIKNKLTDALNLTVILDPDKEKEKNKIKKAVAGDNQALLKTLYNELHTIFGKEKGENNVI